MILLKIVFALVLIASVSLNSAHAQYMFDPLPPNMPAVVLQLIVRDSEGRLVTYIHADQIIGIDLTVLDQYLDDRQNKKTIIINGKSQELVQWQGRTEKIDKTHAMTVFTLYGLVDDTYQIALEILHNSYQVNPGDTVTVYWNVIRPL